MKLYWLQRKQLYWPNGMGGGAVVHPTTGVQYEVTQQKAVDVHMEGATGVPVGTRSSGLRRFLCCTSTLRLCSAARVLWALTA